MLIPNQYNPKDKGEITPSEYLTTLRVIHIVMKRDVSRNNGMCSQCLRDALKTLESYAPLQLSNIVNLLYNSK